MFSYLIKAKNILLDIFFPPICLNCKKSLDNDNKPICDDCLKSIKINNSPFCSVCRARLADNKKICHKNSLFILAAAGEYDDPILQDMIQTFKYRSVKNLAPVLGKILVEYINELEIPQLSNYLITYIPLYKSRERERGFNQAKLIAEFIGKKFNMPIIEYLKRIKKTEAQAKMKNKEGRLKNISGCFEIQNAGLIKGRNIILIDDVFTTGSTLNEASKILKENGCDKIIALVAAKV